MNETIPSSDAAPARPGWNKGKLTGPKPPLRPGHVWLIRAKQCLFLGRRGPDRHLTTRQYARLVSQWVSGIGLDPRKYATHSMRRTKASLIYRRTGNLRAVQLLLGHLRIESTVRYLGVEIDDALDIAEKIEV